MNSVYNKAWVGMAAGMVAQALSMWLDLGGEWQAQFVMAVTGLATGVAVWATPNKDKTVV